MSDRLTSLDASFLYLEESTTAMHVGSVMVFQPPREGFDYDQLVGIIESRIGAIPRFRQKVRDVPGRIANPVWVDDEGFDMSYHVRRAGLPRPGSDEQLQDFVARVQPRKLDRTRPLWEVYLVEGLHDGRFAIVTKTHYSLIDGVNALDIAHVIVDAVKGEGEGFDPTPWEPSRAPSSAELFTGAVVDAVRRPTQVVDLVRGGLNDVLNVGLRAVESAGASTHLANDVTLERVLIRFSAGLQRRRKRRAAAAMDAVTQGVRNGQTLAAAMDSSLTNLERTVLDAGDRAGKLPDSMKLVIEVRELVDRIFWKLILGFAPPLVYVYALYKVLGFIGADVVPEFAGILPAEKWTGWARVLYLMGVFAQSAAMPLMTYGLLVYAAWCAWALPNWSGRGRTFFDRWVFPFPLYREIAGFSWLLSFLALQRAGIPEVESLAAQIRTASPWLASRLLAISSGTRNGFDLAASMARTGHDFPSEDLIDEIGEYMGKAGSSEKLSNVARENALYVERKVLAIGGGMALTLSLLVYAAMFVMQFGSNALSSALTSSMRQM